MSPVSHVADLFLQLIILQFIIFKIAYKSAMPDILSKKKGSGDFHTAYCLQVLFIICFSVYGDKNMTHVLDISVNFVLSLTCCISAL